jgi:hypothetical protein
MKMGNIPSLWRYDAAAGRAPPPHNPGCPAIFRYASRAAVFLISQWGPVRIRAMSPRQVEGAESPNELFDFTIYF